jgi:hypothetical protein
MALLNCNRAGFFRAACLSLLIFLAQGDLVAALPVARRQEVEAVFILNLTRFVRWPDAAFESATAPLVIGIFSSSEMAALMMDAARGESAGGHPIVVRSVNSPAEISECQLVYFGTPDAAQLNPLLGPLRDKPILTVGAVDGFLRLGGHVQFFNRAGQIRLRLDLRNLRRAELSASAALLRVADVVGN